MADVRGRSYETEAFADAKEALTGTLKMFTMLVCRKLDDEHSELLDDIVGDLHSCAFSRAMWMGLTFFSTSFSPHMQPVAGHAVGLETTPQVSLLYISVSNHTFGFCITIFAGCAGLKGCSLAG